LSLTLACVAVAVAACSPKPAAPNGATPDATTSDAAAPGSAAPVADNGSTNPLIGRWTLMSPGDPAVCPEKVQFAESTDVTISNGVTQNNNVLYHAYPGYVNVFANGDLQHYQQYNLTSADVITNVTGNQYAMMNCPYKRD
jgi:hypothetical protein